MASGPYLKALSLRDQGGFNFKTDDLRILLVHNGPDTLGNLGVTHPQNVRATATFLADLALGTYEPTGHPGYDRKELAPSADQTLTEDTVSIESEWSAAALAYTGFDSLGGGKKIVGGVLFRHTGADATARCIYYYDLYAIGKAFDGATGANITLTWPAEGFLKSR